MRLKTAVSHALLVLAVASPAATAASCGSTKPQLNVEVSRHHHYVRITVAQQGTLPRAKHITERHLWVTVDYFNERTGKWAYQPGGLKDHVLAPNESAWDFDYAGLPRALHYRITVDETAEWARGFHPLNFTEPNTEVFIAIWPDGVISTIDPNAATEERP